MVRFETIVEERMNFGRNNFVEVARKKVIDESDRENEFISISRGFFTNDGEPRYSKGKTVTIPVNEADVIHLVAHRRSAAMTGIPGKKS